MKEAVSRNWTGFNSTKKNNRLAFDQATLLGGLGVLMFAYIIFRFIYPLVEKGVLW